MESPARRSVSLVLGGGGARGYAHVGVLRALAEHDLDVRSIAGCSMGALVGGVHALGRLDEYERWARQVDRRQIFSLLDISFGGGGLLKGEKVIASLRELVGDMLIEQLPIRYTAVAADLVRQREVWIDRGPLFDAIRASISLPVFFRPAEHLGVRLVDGGILDPVPIAPTHRDGTDLTIAVSLSGAPAGRGERPVPPEEKAWDLSFVVSQTLDAMQGVITRQRLAAHPPDVLIEIPRDACRLMEFDRAGELIDLGYELAKARLGGL